MLKPRFTPAFHSLRFSPWDIATAAGSLVKLSYLSHRPGLSLLKPEGEAVELCLANISLQLYNFTGSLASIIILIIRRFDSVNQFYDTRDQADLWPNV